MTQTLHIITGPTAVGKTEYALRYAETHKAEIISCDASLVYRGMDIGTAKPTPSERARVPHHLIDLCAVNEPYDIVAYVRDAQHAVEDITGRGKVVVITGGSGFYLKSFFAPVTDTIQVSDAQRAQVAGILEHEGLEGLLAELKRLNPDGVGHLDIQNPRRVMRALERCMASGKTLRDIQAAFHARPVPYANFFKKLILLDREKDALKQRIEMRVQQMLGDGLVDEVERLRMQGIESNSSAASAIGYRETLSLLRGELGIDELGPAIVQNTLHLAKKQRTWYRTQIPKPDVSLHL